MASHSVIYDNAKRHWNNRLEEVAKQRDKAWTAAYVSWAFTAVSIFGLIWIGAQSKFIPYIVENNRLNDVALVAPLHPKQYSAGDERDAIANWIINSRSVLSDPEGQNRNLERAWNMLVVPSVASMKFQEEHEGENHPSVRAKKELVSLDGNSEGMTITVVGDTWTAGWTEVTRNPKNGQVISKKDWRMQIVTKRQPVKTLEETLKNHLGLFITEYSATEVKGHGNG